VGFFKAHDLSVTYPMGEEMSGVPTKREKLGVCSTIGSADQRQWVLQDGRQRVVIVVNEILHGELGFEVFLHRQIEKRINRMLALLLGNLRDGAPFQRSVLGKMHIVDERRVPAEHADRTLFGVSSRRTGLLLARPDRFLRPPWRGQRSRPSSSADCRFYPPSVRP
jgi:hypothetical protein